MSDLKHLPKSIPAKDFEFQFDIDGALTKERYHGDFKCKIPNIKKQSEIAKHVAFLNAGYDLMLDSATKNIHHMVSYLKHTITKGPDWFYESDGCYDLFDSNVIEALYNEVLKKEEEWINTVWPDGQD